eukprot:gene3699-7359_t
MPRSTDSNDDEVARNICSLGSSLTGDIDSSQFISNFHKGDLDDRSSTAGTESSSESDMPPVRHDTSSSYDSSDVNVKNHSGLSLLLEALLQSEASLITDRQNSETNENSKTRIQKRSASPSLQDSERWPMMFGALEEYGRINNHCNVPISYESTVQCGTTVKLGTWLGTQRQLKRKGTLRPEREIKLQSLVDKGMLLWSMPSIASPDDEKWSIMYSALLKYGKTHKNCNAPYNYDCKLDDGTIAKLGAWLRKQRELKKKGYLRPDRFERLQALVDAKLLRMPSAHATDSDDRWMTMMEALEGYCAKHGHCNVSQCHKYKFDDGSTVWLGAWLHKQRDLKKRGNLRPDRIQMLQALVDTNMLRWDVPNHCPSDEENWEAMLNALIQYSNEHGHCNLSSCYEHTMTDGTNVKLGAWLSQQRHHKKKNKLREDREVKLQRLVDEGKLNWGMRDKTTAAWMSPSQSPSPSPFMNGNMIGTGASYIATPTPTGKDKLTRSPDSSMSMPISMSMSTSFKSVSMSGSGSGSGRRGMGDREEGDDNKDDEYEYNELSPTFPQSQLQCQLQLQSELLHESSKLSIATAIAIDSVCDTNITNTIITPAATAIEMTTYDNDNNNNNEDIPMTITSYDQRKSCSPIASGSMSMSLPMLKPIPIPRVGGIISERARVRVRPRASDVVTDDNDNDNDSSQSSSKRVCAEVQCNLLYDDISNKRNISSISSSTSSSTSSESLQSSRRRGGCLSPSSVGGRVGRVGRGRDGLPATANERQRPSTSISPQTQIKVKSSSPIASSFHINNIGDGEDNNNNGDGDNGNLISIKTCDVSRLLTTSSSSSSTFPSVIHVLDTSEHDRDGHPNTPKPNIAVGTTRRIEVDNNNNNNNENNNNTDLKSLTLDKIREIHLSSPLKSSSSSTTTATTTTTTTTTSTNVEECNSNRSSPQKYDKSIATKPETRDQSTSSPVHDVPIPFIDSLSFFNIKYITVNTPSMKLCDEEKDIRNQCIRNKC